MIRKGNSLAYPSSYKIIKQNEVCWYIVKVYSYTACLINFNSIIPLWEH